MRRFYAYFYPLCIVALTSVICALNYTPATFLTGWDTLHPEFNFPQQFSNIFYGVFRSDQGLGAVAAHSHMSELPRMLFLYIESFVLPLSFLRYSYVFLCFVLGPLGVYFFLNHILKGPKTLTRPAAFIGALAYIFNLGTLQHFYVPFEMFVTQYAFLGFLFLSVVLVLEKRTIGRLFLLLILSFFASSMAYAAVLWYAYFACLLCFLLFYFLQTRTKKILFSILSIILITLAANSYWLLPNLYFVTSTAREVSQAQTNRIFSDEAFLHNKQYGNILDAAILKNFLFNWTIQVDANTSEELLKAWKEHLSFPGIVLIGYGIFILSLIGAVLSVVRKQKIIISVIPVFCVSLIMLMNMNPPFDFLFGVLRDNSSLFKEGLRFPFTKFSIPVMFSLSLFAGFGVYESLKNTHKVTDFLMHQGIHLKNVYLQTACVLILLTLLILYGLPFFQGELISKRMRIQIPKEYFSLFSYLQTKDADFKLAPLPVHSLWGWEYNDWGYQGAGFLWFGIPQASLSRDFDRWNPSNEQFYNEITEAIYSRDIQKVETLVKKYKVGYLLLDKSVIFPGNKKNALWHYETQDTLQKSEHIKLTKTFGDKLVLYEVDPKFIGEKIIQTPQNITSIGPKITGGFVDLGAFQFGDYVFSETPEYFYPARSLVNRYDRIDPSKTANTDTDTLLSLPSIPNGYEFTTSWLNDDIFPEFMREYDLDSTTETISLPYLIGQNPYVSIPISSSSATFTGYVNESRDCGALTPKTVSKMTRNSGFVMFESKNGAACGYVDFPRVKQDFGSMLRMEAKNVKGLPLRICVSNKLTRRCEIYTTLDKTQNWQEYVFIIPPQPSGDSGYAININNISIGDDETINDIKNIRLSQIPYYRIQNLYFTNGKTPPKNPAIIQHEAKINPTLYKIEVKNSTPQPGLINFFKAYDSGWQAYKLTTNNPNTLQILFPFFTKHTLLNHMLVNNWANGWIIPPQTSSSIIILFWPQYLEFAGFGVLGVTALLLILLKIITYIAQPHHATIHKIRKIRLKKKLNTLE